MFRAAAPRLIARSALPRAIAPSRRYISTAPPAQKSRSFKSLVARLGIAGTIIYYYNTTDVFAEEPRQFAQALPEIETESESEELPTIESISAERQKRKAVQAQLDAQAEARGAQQQQPDGGAGSGIEGLEEEADQQGAFNPETGEINWDCPCLGGMATGPCGEQFKAAFSCFVYSQEEPKGMDCIDKFKDMQNCFREYPEVYGSELEGDDDEAEGDGVTAPVYADSASSPKSTPEQTSSQEHAAPQKQKRPAEPQSQSASSPSSGANLALVPDNYKPDASEPLSESESLVPKAAHDAGGDNTKLSERK
ncbi:hypothetical protein DE146DRAFT_667593 [Phaeosphaeria sp. MPI-PUGE-AT-0046c]|nr:hypothetical protein DE146DRAFT_667593 [Phaeosphaeria sp. MPI-PUGE-AT-0046c]